MASSRYPLYNIRKTPNGIWQQIHETGETVTVPGSASYYTARLKEVPDNGSVHSKPTIIGLTRAERYPPSASQFWVNYSTGDLVFSDELEGQSFSVDYWKRGSLIDVDDINLLYNRIIELTRDPVATDVGYEVGTLWVNTDTNTYFVCTNNVVAIWVPRGGTSGTSGVSIVSTGASYIHIQTPAASAWTVSHNLGVKYPNVEIYDTNNDIIIPYNINAQDDNTLVITFPEPVEGRAILIFGAGTSGTSGTSPPGFTSGTSGSSGVSGSSGTSGTSGVSDVGYLHTQSSTSGTWSIPHNLNYKYLNVEVYDTNDVVVIPYEIRALDANNVTITFPEPVAGIAVLSF